MATTDDLTVQYDNRPDWHFRLVVGFLRFLQRFPHKEFFFLKFHVLTDRRAWSRLDCAVSQTPYLSNLDTSLGK